MLWSQLSVQTLREENHPLLVRAGYRSPGHGALAEWLELGRRSLAKIARIVGEESGLGSALDRCGVRHFAASNACVVESAAGDNVLVQGHNYAELLERAASVPKPPDVQDPDHDSPPEEFHTPGVKTIAQIAEFSGLPATSQIKSLVMMADGALLLVLLRGDHQMSQRKFALITAASNIRQATPEEIREKFGAEAGSLGPLGAEGIRILADEALRGRRNMIAGANRNDYHVRNVTPGRDFTPEFAGLRLAGEGDACVHGGPLSFRPVAVVEAAADILTASAAQNFDADGLALPAAIAPFLAVVTPVHPERLAAAREIYSTLRAAGCDAVLDDRDARPGVKFKDADLIGFPYRINVGKKLTEGLVEFVARNPKASVDISPQEAAARVAGGV